MTTTLLWAVRSRRGCGPYLVPVTVYVIVGLVAALASAVAFRGGTAVAQEIFLFLWCASLDHLVPHPECSECCCARGP